jgi:predicted nuclease of predicted toxin-antitoxin system
MDFSAILAATQARGPSVVQIRAQNLDPRVLGDRVVKAVRQQTSALQAGALLAVRDDVWQVRILPLSAPAA